MSETVIRGRFAPPTFDAVAVIRRALSSGSVQVVVTGADLARSSRLPWTVAERTDMLRLALGEDAGRVTISVADGRNGESIAHVPALVSAFLDGEDVPAPAAVAGWLDGFRQTEEFAGMVEEARYVEDYKRAWAMAPYPVILVSVDTVIVHADPRGMPHVLLIRRGGIPGRGNFAIPGGFIEPDEYLLNSALRELREETGLVLSDAEAMARLKGRHVFDDPERSSRGRVITHGFHFEFPAGPLPGVEGQDDAAEARWVPVADLAQYHGQFFEDHGAILRHFLGD
ncbi:MULTISPECIES: NUDIX domain-containing protein [Asticcacaulis]|uniref:NUDIX domain-containing protein n=1 Tax=Asticcacaulis TaxID=76890 RepID=UPI001AE42AFF|nr:MULTISPECIES: NUDIX domain-containing protein [Asticcacaulis]MBP2161097.1 bifunctional NMN adenylyltransferase/nudix hydrolase [Asticcacaulis solisilvae]MDR6802142.1 bifunctional NMN adenylyltransferase/nudix hydrolase [Asticcacaulis sp. BE141]